MPRKKTLFLDVECYSNYFLILFKDEEGNEESFTLDDNHTLPKARIKNLLNSFKTVGFNSRMYDIPMILCALKGVNNTKLKSLSDRIIGKDEKTFDILCDERLWTPKDYDHVDIMNVAIGRASLKMYGARINIIFLQDLPYDPAQILSEEDKQVIKKYCSNDVDITKDLYIKLNKELSIRENINNSYGVDVRSKGDAQIAELLVNKELTSTNLKSDIFDFKYDSERLFEVEDITSGNYVGTSYTSKLGDSEFRKSGILDKIASMRFKGKKGDQLLPDSKDNKIKIGDSTYTIGIGGLHSTEQNRTVYASENSSLIDIDVVSYYPSIILNNKYAPTNYNKDAFLEFYEAIKTERIEAKEKGDIVKSDIYKIILNGIYGKFGDQYSSLYSPELLINTTISGQLYLLALIQMLESNGYEVVSANTDGIVVNPKTNQCLDIMDNIVLEWEHYFNFQTTRTHYKSLHSQSVNSYIAVKTDGTVKLKGFFAYGDLSRNPAIEVCKEAVINYIQKDCKIENTVRNCKDKSKFLMVRKVKDGGYWNDEYLGKVVRWYWGKDGLPITNLKGDRVANSEGAKPVMNLREEIVNIDYDKYIEKSYKFLEELGVERNDA